VADPVFVIFRDRFGYAAKTALLTGILLIAIIVEKTYFKISSPALYETACILQNTSVYQNR
jgi:hypothetical protein